MSEVLATEAALLKRINARLPATIQRRYESLMTKRDAETLTETEYAELLQLTQQAEAFDVGRVEALLQLAAHRGLSLNALLQQLGLAYPVHV